MKIIAISLLIFIGMNNAYADDLENIKAVNFMKKLDAYSAMNSSNQDIFLEYAKLKNPTESQTSMYFLTICNYKRNLERAEKLIDDNPEYAQYIDGAILPSIQDQLDYARHLAKVLDNSRFECGY